MKEYCLPLWIRIHIVIIVLLLLVSTTGIFLKGCPYFIIKAISVAAFLLSAIYYYKVLKAFSKDTFKKMTIKRHAGFTLTTIDKETLYLPFEDIESINIFKGEVINNTPICHIKFITKDEKTYGITIIEDKSFYKAISKRLKINVEEAHFYKPRWNNMY